MPHQARKKFKTFAIFPQFLPFDNTYERQRYNFKNFAGLPLPTLTEYRKGVESEPSGYALDCT